MNASLIALLDPHRFFENYAESRISTTIDVIFLESVYQSLEESSQHKNAIVSFRKKRWTNHFGIPTVEFLLTYADLIERIKSSMVTKTPFTKISSTAVVKPHFTYDARNQLYVDPTILYSVPLPQSDHTFVPTYNPVGGYTTHYVDSCSQPFIDYSADCTENNLPVLDVASGFGIATLGALAKGATVICNDIEPKNLSVIYQRQQHNDAIKKQSLQLVAAKFPEEFHSIPHQSIGAILICRLLHFFPGEKVLAALSRAKDLLVPGGKIFIVAETPYLSNWRSFWGEYEKRVEEGMPWPGEVTDVSQFESGEYNQRLPSFMHLLDKDILMNAVKQAGFTIEKAEYIDRRGIFPDSLACEGKESVGIIGVKSLENG